MLFDGMNNHNRDFRSWTTTMVSLGHGQPQWLVRVWTTTTVILGHGQPQWLV